LRRDPFERADENSNTYWDWFIDHLFIVQGGVGVVMELSQSFRDFPPRQKPGSFNIDAVLEEMKEASGGGHH
jgi:arylsulfatase